MKDFARASALSGYGQFAQMHGLNPEQMLTTVGLPENILKQAEGVISYRRFLHLLELSAEQSNEPLFGLKFGLYQGVSVFGPLLYLIRNCQTFGEALKELQQFFHLHMGAAQLTFSQKDDLAQLTYHVLDPTQPGIKQGMELALGVGYQLLRTLLGKHWVAKAITAEHAPQDSLKTYTKLLGQAPIFNHTESGIFIEVKSLSEPLINADPELHNLMKKHLHSMEELSTQELPSYVEYLLRNLLAQGQANIEKVTQCMAMSKRTLQRRLAESDTSFKEILDHTRQVMAYRYLKDSRLQMTQLADLLGYTSLSAFTRAFIRWHGYPPSKWKENQPYPNFG
tara:strand:+ start:842 stop:1855 length:1014 start_codon:yes stop_codon:yes gene_type:complete